MPTTVVAVALVGGVSMMACGSDLGPCDNGAAEAVVFDTFGTPAYAGQALTQTTCGNGAFCHAELAAGRDRFGAPADLNFDAAIATTGVDPAPVSTERLRQGVAHIRDEAEGMWEEVDAGRMAPGGDTTLLAQAGAPVYSFDGGGTLPGLDTAEGRDIFRNWLACGAPVVERTTPRPSGLEPVGDVVAARSVALEATFGSIFANYLSPTCGQSCHGPNDPGNLALSNLDLSTQTAAFNNLISTPAMGVECEGTGVRRVVPNDPDNSLLVQKLAGTQTCGASMPLGGSVAPEVVNVIRSWVQGGAAND